ncbi:MAG: 4Fe-4S binding protein [Bacteroidales bacterium]|nr:4Fe-4S binding protein [Bacteroidales bacterium]
MAKRSTILKNWPKYLLQWGVLGAIIIFLTGVIPSETAADPEAYCPMGGLQALATYLANNSLPCSMSSLQVMMGIALVAAVVLFSKLFCGYICPLGTVQDLIVKARNAMHVKSIKIRNGSAADKALRIVKYALVFWIFYMTVNASELFCKNLDPYYAVATGFKGEITLWMSIVSISLVVIGSFFIDMFWCRYLCPLGAISNTLKFWIWIGVLFGIYYVSGVLGADIPWAVLLGGFCIVGYLLEIFHSKPKFQILHVTKDDNLCNNCGLCVKKCPYHIDVKSVHDGKLSHVDCTLCGECVASCSSRALNIGICKPRRGKLWKIVPAVLTVVLIAFGMWAGGKFELPTIDMKWGIEDESTLQTMSMEGLRSVKCYGSSMTFKAKLEKIPGVHGVKTYVKRHSADILYDPAKTDAEKIQEAVFVPSKFRVATPDHKEVPELKIVTIRTEGMYDKMDINYLGMQMRLTGKRIYGLETEFACPLIVRVYMDPAEDLDEDWFEEIVEKETLEMPVHGGGVNEIELGYKFEDYEGETGRISTEQFIRSMFSPFSVQWKSRIEAAEGKQQYVYEIVDKNYEKPIILRNMPFLSNHLSRHEGVIGVYLDLNRDLQPSIQIRYADPMTEAKLWELMTMETWTITYKADDVREEPAKFSFKTAGNSYEYNE